MKDSWDDVVVSSFVGRTKLYWDWAMPPTDRMHLKPYDGSYWTETGANNIKFGDGYSNDWYIEPPRPFPAAEAFFFGVLLGLLITLAICRKALK